MKVGRPPGREKKEMKKTSSEALPVAASKEKWKDLVWGLRSTRDKCDYDEYVWNVTHTQKVFIGNMTKI